METLYEYNWRERMREWLNAPGVSTNLNAADELRYEDRPLWILEDEIFKTWLRRDISHLWLHGSPGCGKTVISSTIIRHLQRTAGPEATLVYFFFDNQDEKMQNLDQALRCLIVSLIIEMCYTAYARVQTSLVVQELYVTCEFGNVQPTLAQIRECFHKIVQDRDITILFDGLDECPDLVARKQVLEWVNEASLTDGMRVIFTSRDEDDINVELPSEQFHKIKIDGDAQDHDIRRFIESKVDDPKGGFIRWKERPEVPQMIKTSLIKEAKGK